MKGFKGTILALICVLLVLSLIAFGLTLTVKSTVLNRQFFAAELDKLDVAGLVTEEIGSMDGLSPEAQEAIVQAIPRVQPELKSQLKEANSLINDYLFGRTHKLDLREVLKETFFSQEFVDSVANDPAVLSAIRQSLRKELVQYIPSSLPQLVTYLDLALPSLDPWLRQQVTASSGPVVDYLLGDSPTLRIAIPLDQMKATLKIAARSAFLSSPPPQLAALPKGQLDAVFNQYYDPFANRIPASAIIDDSTIGFEPTSFSSAIADATDVLASLKVAAGYIQVFYFILVFLVLALVAAVVLIRRRVSGAARDIGIAFLASGVLSALGVLIGRIAMGRGAFASFPAAVRSWLPQLYWDALKPLGLFGFVVAVVGIALLILSFAYRSRNV